MCVVKYVLENVDDASDDDTCPSGQMVRVTLTGSRSVNSSVFVSSIGVIVDVFPLYRVA